MSQVFERNFSLAGQVAFVTGSCRGLGLEIAAALADLGATTVIHSRDAGKAEHTATALARLGFKTDWCAFDVTDTQGRLAAFAQISEKYGRLDVLVNNASVRIRKALAKLSEAEIFSVMNTNLLATIEITRSALDLMMKRSYGRIVTITSVAGSQARAGDFIYPISKSALEAMTRAVAVEYGRHGIVCNAIAPSAFQTEINADMTALAENIPRMKDRTPVQRWGAPCEIVAPAVFLASPGASYINGSTVVVDGGRSVSL